MAPADPKKLFDPKPNKNESEFDRSIIVYQHNEQARAALTYSSKKPTRPDATEAPQQKEEATHTRRNRHDHNRKQDVVNSSGCGISSCEVGSDLARPGKSSCEVSSHLEKMYLVIEHNHQSFEQLGTSSRDIGSRKSEASSSCRGKHNHFEPVE